MPFTIDDFDTLTKPAEAAPAAMPVEPAPAAPAARKRGITIDDYLPPEPTALDKAPLENKPREGGPSAISRGIWSGTATTPEALAGVADTLDDITGDTDEGSKTKQFAGWLRGQSEYLKSGGHELQSKGLLEVKSLDEFGTWLGEAIGQGIGSTAAPIAGALAGAGVGAVTPIPGGAATGALLGQGGVNMATGIGSMRNALYADPDIRKKVDDGDISKQQLVPYVIGGGMVVGALDSYGVDKIMKLTGLGKEAVENAVKLSIRKAVLEGAVTEGWTEAFQNIVEDVTVSLSGGKTDVKESLKDAFEAGAAGAAGGGAMGGGARVGGKIVETVAGQPAPKEQVETVESVDQETRDAPGASTPGGLGEPPPQPSAAAPGADPEVVRVNPGIDPDLAAAGAGIPVTPAQQTPTVTSVAAPARVPAEERTAADWQGTAAPNVSRETLDEIEDEEGVYDETLYGDLPELAKEMTIRPAPVAEQQEITVAAPRDAEVAALKAGPPEPVGTGQSPPRKPVTVEPLPGTTPPPGEPPLGGRPPSAGTLEEMPPAPLQAGPGVGVAAPAAVPSAGAVPGVPAGSAVAVGAAPQGGPVGGEPVAQVPEMRGPPAAEAGVVQGVLAPAAEATGGVRPATDIAGAPPDVQPPATQAATALPPLVEAVQPGLAEEPVTSPAVEAALPRRSADAAGQLRDIVRTALDEDQYSRDQIDAVTDEVIRGITPRLAEHTGSVGEMVREFQDEALATARRRLPALAEELELHEAERSAAEIRGALERASAQAREKRATGAAQERARTTQAGVKAAEDLEREGELDEKPFQRRAEKAVKEQGENAPAYYREGLAAIAERKATGRGKAKGEKAEQREAARRKLAAARAEEVAARREAEAAEAEAERQRAAPEKEEGTAKVSPEERRKQAAKRKKIRAKAGLNKKVDPELTSALREAEMPRVQDYGTPGWGKQIRAVINDLWKRFTPRNKDGSEMTKVSPDNAPETNFLIFAKNNMKTEDGLVDIASAKEFIDQGRMIDAANIMRNDDDASAGIGTTGLGETGSWDADEGAFAEGDINEWGLAEHESVFALEDPSPSFTTYDENGQPVQTPVDKSQVSDVGTELKRLAAASPDEVSRILGDSVPKALRKKFVERLTALVGNTPVYKISRIEMLMAIPEDQRHRITNPAGLYVRPSDEALARGDPGYILVNSDQTALTPLHVMMHEATHAATVAAISNDWNGTRKIFARMYRWAQKANPGTSAYGLAQESLGSGLYEFVAEAFSNLSFQELLARTVLPETLANDIKAISATGKPTAWDMFVASVAHGLRMLGFGKKGMSMIEGVVRMAPTVMLSTHEQSARMAETLDNDLERQLNALAEPRGHADPLPLMRSVRASHEAVRQQKTNIAGSLRRAHMSWLQTTAGLMRSSRELFGGENNVFEKAAERLLRRDAAVMQHRREGNQIAQDKARFQKQNPTEAIAMDDVLQQSAIQGIDPRLDVAGNVSKNNVSKAGTTDAFKRAEIEKLHAAWNKLSPAAKAQAEKEIAFYTKANTDAANAQIDHMVKQIVQSGVTLPKGVTEADLVQWVKSKAIHRETGHAVRPRTQADEDMHAALGGSAETLAALEKTLQRNGIYAPLMREGNWVVTAREKVKVPPGATVADARLMPKAKQRDNMLVFKDKKAVEAYQKQAVKDGLQISAVDSVWIDPATGKRIIKQEPQAEQRWVVHVQNKIVEFVDSEAEAKARAKELRGQGHVVHDAQQRETFMASGINDISPAHVTRLLHAVDQQQGNNQDMARFMKAQVQLAALRTQSGNRARHRNLKRQGVKGYARDNLRAMLNYNSAHAHFMASLQEGSAAWDYLAKAREYAEAHRTDVGGEVQRRQEHINELRKRLENRNWSDSSGENLIKQATNYSALVYLASPAYSLINSLQPAMLTFPVLSGKYGMANTMREMGRAYARIGYLRSFGRGAMMTGRAGKGLVTGSTPLFSVHDNLTKMFAKDKDGALLAKAFTYARDTGMLDDAGLEQELTEHGKSLPSRIIHRVSAIARALPTAIEMLNRGVTLVASVRIQKALDPSLSDEVVLRRAMHDLEQTQFGYAGANMPTMFNHPVGAALLQFKKYGVSAGNMIGHNIVKLTRGTGPERKRALKTLALITMMGVAFAGVAGVPGVELFKTIGLILNLTLATGDWDDAESYLQTMLARLTGATTAEAIVRGMPRLMNLDLSSRVGYDSMYLFGEPKKTDEASTKAWIFDTLAGPVVGMATALGKFVESGDPSKAPLPKLLSDTIKGWQKYQKGEFTATEAATKAIGIQPGSAPAQYETGPKRIGIKKAEQKKAGQADRNKVMNAWLNIPPGPKRAAARREAWEDIKAYNKTVPRKEQIDRGDLVRSEQRRKKEERKNLREAKAA